MHGIPKDKPQITVSDISGTSNVKGMRSSSYPTPVGRLVARQNSNSTNRIISYDYTHTHQIDFEIELDSKRIEAIEQIRLGGELTFSISLYATATQNENSTPLHNQPYELLVSQSDWIKVLESIGYQKTLLLEIPVPTGETNATFAEAAKHLGTAQKHMLLGHYRDAVGACRDVLESMNRFLYSEDNPAQTSKRKRDKSERISAVRVSLYELTSAAKHADDTTSLIEWNLADARASISMAATLLQWANEECCN